mmetsp:Transcript_58790/g.124673  ORF Transcript_58790/g.124673 Transcript_58790/m.124673 type:complete len:320 (+) Transcript_58790:63-1022(+)
MQLPHNLELDPESEASSLEEIALDVLAGLRSFLLGGVLAVKTLTTTDHLKSHARFTPIVVVIAGATTLVLALLASPFSLTGLYKPTWQELLRPSCFFVLAIMRWILLQPTRRWWFDVLSREDRALAAQIEEMPVQASLKGRLLTLLLEVGAGIVAVVLAILAAPLLLGFLVLWQVWAGILLGAATLSCLLSGFSKMSYIFRFAKLFKVYPVFTTILIVVMLVGWLCHVDVKLLVKTAGLMYYSCTYLSAEMMMTYGERVSPEQWKKFTKANRWRLVGFGLPLWALLEFLPVLFVLLLQLSNGASVKLLSDLSAARRRAQ